jgi:hypothetical protein
VNELIEKIKREGRRDYLAFIEMEKVYNRVDRKLF